MDFWFVWCVGLILPGIYLLNVVLNYSPKRKSYLTQIYIASVAIRACVVIHLSYGGILGEKISDKFYVLEKLPITVLIPIMLCLFMLAWKVKQKSEEVNIRYLLDKLPMMQMKIDEEVNCNKISWEKVSIKRNALVALSLFWTKNAMLAKIMKIEAVILIIVNLATYIIGIAIIGIQSVSIILIQGFVSMGSALCMLISLYIITSRAYTSLESGMYENIVEVCADS